jgi:anti-sigma regulatory factor (Ser/Thr protein kinase)
VSPSRSGSDCHPFGAEAFPVTETSHVGEARRRGAALAQRLGFDETGAGKAAIVVTEAATNLVKHGTQGELHLRPLERDGVGGLEVLALDRGPGMADLGRCLRDGFSTAGTSGTGLGAIARLSDFFDIHTAPQVGTALLARLWAWPVPGGEPEVGAAHVAKPGEPVCGDGWAVEHLPGRVGVLVADGLGHGPIAADAAAQAVRVFRASFTLGPAAALRAMHDALRSTRGAAAAIADLDFAAGTLHYAGVGNISGTVLSGGASRSAVSHNGTLGHEARKFQEFAYDFPRDATLVMHSDGLTSHWNLDRYPGLLTRHPALLAGVLCRDFKRGRDDVTVVAVREGAGERGA